MQHLSKLLEIENSKLAWVLRLNLYGLRTQLQEALKEDTTDPGNSACQELVGELDQLLQPQKLEIITPQTPPPSPTSSTSSTPPTWEDVLEPIQLEIPKEQKLKDIGDALLADQELLQYVGAYKFQSNNDLDLWNEIQRLLLRVPEKLADTWRECILAEVSQFGALEEKFAVQQIGFSRNQPVYPGLQGSVYATGLFLSDQVDFDPQLQVEKRGGKLDVLAGIVSVCLKFIEIDPCLRHALKSVDRFGVRPLNSDSESSKYMTALVERFQRVLTTTNADPAIALRARLDLDEAIHSLVYLPPCDRFSWWGKLQQEARRTLDGVVEKARNAGYQVQVRPLWGTYADIYTWSKDDLQLEIGGVPGEVSACLRVYAKINDEVIPGRVLFRSSLEG
ncbi:MAG: hypothetical protein KME28_06840 [Pelatocladus maniniholoensis HA4357-MV3]|jgi:hypothetical protein|uniref:Uncharacterized protein n=1 Tax=Pelatocladus maniniholoensis HA4357-MV3 TaxID=1117104 RepID=A0A9E3H5W2_9NOST|nr:hypothetical protein [Pelatocladus maniniholoensis HA4357-MV3]